MLLPWSRCNYCWCNFLIQLSVHWIMMYALWSQVAGDTQSYMYHVLSQWCTPILQHPYFLPNPFSQARAWGRPLPEADWLFAQPVSSHPLCTSLHSATCSEQNKRKIERGKKKSVNDWKLSVILKQFYVFQESEELEIQKQKVKFKCSCMVIYVCRWEKARGVIQLKAI